MPFSLQIVILSMYSRTPFGFNNAVAVYYVPVKWTIHTKHTCKDSFIKIN